MKKRILVLAVVLTLLVGLLPVTALAAKPAELTVEVRNQTGDVAEASLTDADGNISYFSLPTGVSEITLTEGVYTAYINTICGAWAETWRVDVHKVLYLDCKTGNGAVVQYQRCRWVAEEYRHGKGLRGNGIMPKFGGYIDLDAYYDNYILNHYLDWPLDKFLWVYPFAAECRYGIMPEDLIEGEVIPG